MIGPLGSKTRISLYAFCLQSGDYLIGMITYYTTKIEPIQDHNPYEFRETAFIYIHAVTET